MPQRHTKDPDAILDYSIDWSAWLDGDTIATSAWEAQTGIAIEDDPAPSHTTTTATVWVSGGEVGNCYALTNSITTAAGRSDQRSILLSVEER